MLQSYANERYILKIATNDFGGAVKHNEYKLGGPEIVLSYVSERNDHRLTYECLEWGHAYHGYYAINHDGFQAIVHFTKGKQARTNTVYTPMTPKGTYLLPI